MKTSDVKNEIINSLKAPFSNLTNGVILLDGKWGSGKTYLWDHEILPELKTKSPIIKRKFPIIKRKFPIIYVSCFKRKFPIIYVSCFKRKSPIIYVSCFNSASATELRYTIAAQLLMKGWTNLKNFPKFIDILLIFFQKKTGLEVLNLNFDPLSICKDDFIVCIDDLERINDKKQMRDTLGLISFLNEKKRAKVLVIANESKILQKTCKTSNIYKEFKEKVIYCNFKINADIIFFLDKLIKTTPEKTQKYLNENIETIKKAISVSKEENLRTLSKLINFIRRIIEHDLPLKHNFLQNLIFYVFSTNGKWSQKSSEHFDFNPTYLRINSEKLSEEDEDRLETLEKFFENYTEYEFYKPLFELVYSTKFDIEEMTELLKPKVIKLHPVQKLIINFDNPSEDENYYFQKDSFFKEKYSEGFNLLENFPKKTTAIQLANLINILTICKKILNESIPDSISQIGSDKFKQLALEGDHTFLKGSSGREYMEERPHYWAKAVISYDQNINKGLLTNAKKKIKSIIDKDGLGNLKKMIISSDEIYFKSLCLNFSTDYLSSLYFNNREGMYFLLISLIKNKAKVKDTNEQALCLKNIYETISKILNSEKFDNSDAFRFENLTTTCLKYVNENEKSELTNFKKKILEIRGKSEPFVIY